MKYTPEITIVVRPECIPVKGNAMASGDDELDKQVEDEINARLNDGDIWAWCHVEVQAEFREIIARDFLGGCSYKDEQDFMQDGYYQDMVAEACRELAEKIDNLQGVKITCVAGWEAEVQYKG